MPSSGQRNVFHSRSLRAHLKRIAKLHPYLGETLDARAAPLRVYVFIAYARDRTERPLIAGQQDRFRAALAFFEQHKRWPLIPEIRDLRVRVDSPPVIEAPPARVPVQDLALGFAVAAQAQDPELAELLKRFSEERRKRAPAPSKTP